MAIQQDETSITLQWNTVGNSLFVLRYESREENITTSKTVETKKISNLNNTKGYDFSLFTVFEGVESSGKYLTAFTGKRIIIMGLNLGKSACGGTQKVLQK